MNGRNVVVRWALLSLAFALVLACLTPDQFGNNSGRQQVTKVPRHRAGRILFGSGYYRLPAGRTWRNGRYYGNFNNRFYGPQYGYF